MTKKLKITLHVANILRLLLSLVSPRCCKFVCVVCVSVCMYVCVVCGDSGDGGGVCVCACMCHACLYVRPIGTRYISLLFRETLSSNLSQQKCNDIVVHHKLQCIFQMQAKMSAWVHRELIRSSQLVQEQLCQWKPFYNNIHSYCTLSVIIFIGTCIGEPQTQSAECSGYIM